MAKSLVEEAMEEGKIILKLNSRPMDYSEIVKMEVEDLFYMGISILGNQVFIDCNKKPSIERIHATWQQREEGIEREYSEGENPEKLLEEVYTEILIGDKER